MRVAQSNASDSSSPVFSQDLGLPVSWTLPRERRMLCGWWVGTVGRVPEPWGSRFSGLAFQE